MNSEGLGAMLHPATSAPGGSSLPPVGGAKSKTSGHLGPLLQPSTRDDITKRDAAGGTAPVAVATVNSTNPIIAEGDGNSPSPAPLHLTPLEQQPPRGAPFATLPTVEDGVNLPKTSSLDDLFRVLQLPDDGPMDEIMATIHGDGGDLGKPRAGPMAATNPLDALFRDEEARQTPPLKDRQLPTSFFAQPAAAGNHRPNLHHHHHPHQQQHPQQEAFVANDPLMATPGTQSQYATARTQVHIIQDNTLPPGWEAAKTHDGLTYYVNHVDRSTQWDRPVVTPAPAPWQPPSPTSKWAPTSPRARHNSGRRRSSAGGARRPSTISMAARRGSVASSVDSVFMLSDLAQRRHTVVAGGDEAHDPLGALLSDDEAQDQKRQRAFSLDCFLDANESPRTDKRRRSVQYDLETCLEDVANDDVRADFHTSFDPDAFGSILESLTAS